MKASNFVKTFAATILLSSVFTATGANADNGYIAINFGGVEGDRAQYRHSDRDGRSSYRPYADDTNRYVERRQATQRERIRDGLRQGELTSREAARLAHEQMEIDRLQRFYLVDGYLDRGERLRLRRELDEASRHIWQEQHDDQDRRDYRAWRD